MDLRAWADELARSGAALLRVRGGSMAPSLLDGDVVSVQAAPPRRGDLAVVRAGDRLLCHRLLSSGRGHVTLFGESRAVVERLAVPSEAQVIGRIEAVLRGGRFRPPRRALAALAASVVLAPLRKLLR